VLLEKQGDTFTAAYTHGNALLRRNSEYPLYDGHGSERTVTNGSETVTGTINFEAFGQTAGTTGSSSSPYMYAGAWGYRTDGDAGLMHVGARYYDAQVGRFITRDTLLSKHPYLHCEHAELVWEHKVGVVAPDDGVTEWQPASPINFATHVSNALHRLNIVTFRMPGRYSVRLCLRQTGQEEWGTPVVVRPFFVNEPASVETGIAEVAPEPAE